MATNVSQATFLIPSKCVADVFLVLIFSTTPMLGSPTSFDSSFTISIPIPMYTLAIPYPYGCQVGRPTRKKKGSRGHQHGSEGV